MEEMCIYYTSLHTSPQVITLAWLLFNLFSRWLSSDIQARKELIDQARIFKGILVTRIFFRHP
jgi:hypothetical protein